MVTVGFSSKLHFLYLLLRSSQQPKLSVRMFQVGRVRLVQSHRSRSLSSRADFPDSGALLRDSRRTQPLLVFVSIKGKEEAFLLPERMASKSLHPVAQCCTFTGGAAGSAEELRCAHELVCPFSEQTNVFTDSVLSVSLGLCCRHPHTAFVRREKVEARFQMIGGY